MVASGANTEIRCWGSFLTLPENRAALIAMRAQVKSLKPVANPLLLHGSPGVGKTHLVSEFLKHIARGPAVRTARSVSVGDLARTEPGFTDRDLATCDVLILEDVHLLPSRAADDLAALLDHRFARCRTTIITSNSGPAALKHLPRRLTSRLSAGLVVQLEPIGPVSRRAVLEVAARKRKLPLTTEALDWLSEQAEGGGLRPLFGLVETLVQVAPRGLGRLDAPAVQRVLAAAGRPPASKRDVSRVVKHVAQAYGVSPKDLLGSSRLRRVMAPRHVAIYLARELSGLSLPRLGAAFGRDHTTILHACRKVETGVVSDAVLAGKVRQLRNELQ